MQALRILLRAVRQVFGNFRQALAMSVVPVVAGVVAVVTAIVARLWWTGGVTASSMALLAVAWLALSFTLVWIAVRWHRFILLDERQGVFSRPLLLPILRYAWIALLIVLVLILPFFAVRAIVSLIESLGSTFLAMMVSLVFSVLLHSFAIILATALPAAAIGVPNPIQMAWKALNPAGGTIILLAVLGYLVEALIDLVGALVNLPFVMAGQGETGLAVTWMAHWLTWLIGISVLTTLWGHYVEGRSLR